MVKPGDIFYTSWGYEQTNVEFYQVVRATEKTVWVREIHGAFTSGNYWSGTVAPVKDEFKSDVVLRRKLNDPKSPYIKVNAVAHGWLYEEGKELYSSSYA